MFYDSCNVSNRQSIDADFYNEACSRNGGGGRLVEIRQYQNYKTYIFEYPNHEKGIIMTQETERDGLRKTLNKRIVRFDEATGTLTLVQCENCEANRVVMAQAKPVEVRELAHHIYDADKEGVLAFVWCEISAQAILSRYNVTKKEGV